MRRVDILRRKPDFIGMTNQIPFAFDIPSVSELTADIKNLLENRFRDILVEGEISNVNQSRNGHYYFTVKDDEAQLPCVIWRSTAARLKVDLRDGQQVVLGGDLQVYPPHGRYQLIVSLVQQAGVGRLQKKFEELKAKLESEGIFNEVHKKALHPFPIRIGVITSSSGAAFHDIKSTFEQRWPVATLYLHHASVQGLQAAPELVRALHYFEKQAEPVDLIIIGRGGGSLEDLWPFNEEAVARAIFNSAIPIVSAVGHEVDFSISDFVADARAATPTQAAVISSPDINELRYQLEDDLQTILRLMQDKISGYRDYIDRLTGSHALLVVREKLLMQQNKIGNLSERLQSRIGTLLLEKRSKLDRLTGVFEQHSPISLLNRRRDRVENLQEKLNSNISRVLTDKRNRLALLLSTMRENNPKAPLEKGFTRILQDGRWIRSRDRFNPDSETEIEWHDGKKVIS